TPLRGHVRVAGCRLQVGFRAHLQVVGCRLQVGSRKNERERRALAWRRGDGDPAAMCVDDTLHEAQAEAVAVDLPVARIAAAVERLEDVREILGRNAAAAIRYRNRYLALVPARAARDGHADPTTVRAVLDGITHEIQQRPADRVLFRHHCGCTVFNLDLECQRLGFRQRLRRGDDIANEPARIDGPLRMEALGVREAGVLEDLFDHVREPASLGLDEIAVSLCLLGVVDDAGRKVLRGRADDRHRRPQLVRHRGDKVELLRCQLLRTACIDENQEGARRKHAEDAEAQPEIPCPDAADSSVQEDVPLARAATWLAETVAECCSITIESSSAIRAGLVTSARPALPPDEPAAGSDALADHIIVALGDCVPVTAVTTPLTDSIRIPKNAADASDFSALSIWPAGRPRERSTFDLPSRTATRYRSDPPSGKMRSTSAGNTVLVTCSRSISSTT